MKLKRFEDSLFGKLRNSEYAAAYLEAAMEDGGVSEFLYALRDVAAANGGFQDLATRSHHGRESLYKSLSKQGNPHIRTLDDVLQVLGMRIAITHRVPNRDGDPMSDTTSAPA